MDIETKMICRVSSGVCCMSAELEDRKETVEGPASVGKTGQATSNPTSRWVEDRHKGRRACKTTRLERAASCKLVESRCGADGLHMHVVGCVFLSTIILHASRSYSALLSSITSCLDAFPLVAGARRARGQTQLHLRRRLVANHFDTSACRGWQSWFAVDSREATNIASPSHSPEPSSHYGSVLFFSL